MVLHIKAILARLGLDLGGSWGRLCASWGPSWLQLGVQDRSKSRPRAHKSCPREPKIVQEPPKTAQDSPRASQERPRRPRSSPRAAQESPRAAQDSPRASQKPTKMPKSSSGPAQDVPRTCSGAAQDLPEPLETQRITCDLTRNPSFTTQFFRTSFQATKRPKSKTSGGGTPPKRVFNNI